MGGRLLSLAAEREGEDWKKKKRRREEGGGFVHGLWACWEKKK